MKKLLPISITILLVFIFSTQAFAQDVAPTAATGSSTVQPGRMPAINGVRDLRKDEAKKLEDRRNLLTQKVENKIVKREEIIETREERIASRTAILKEKLQIFKNKKKVEIIEKVSLNLNKINENRTAEMSNHLQKMSELLTKVENKANSQNTASASAATANAKIAIATAEAAVTTQSQKDYTVQATTESKIRVDVKSSRDQLFTDLTATRKLVLEARQALVNAVMAVTGKEAINNGQ